jgi:hypothetical protein
MSVRGTMTSRTSVFLGQVDQVTQLGLRGERPVAEPLAGGQRVAEQDEQLGQRAEDAGQAVHDRGAGQRDRLGVLAAQRTRHDPDHHVTDHDHHDGGPDVGPALVVHEVDEQQGGDDRRDQLAAQPEQQQQVEVARRVVDDGLQPRRAAPALARVFLGAHPGDARQCRFRTGDQATDDHEGDGQQQPGVHRELRTSCHDSRSRACKPNISLCSSGSAWS